MLEREILFLSTILQYFLYVIPFLRLFRISSEKTVQNKREKQEAKMLFFFFH